MEDVEQVRVYARADFAEENQGFVDLFFESCPEWSGGHVIDLGCGPGIFRSDSRANFRVLV